MERVRRKKLEPDPGPKPAKSIVELKRSGKVQSHLSFRRVARSDVTNLEESRWYFLGKVKVAFVQVYDPGTMASGDFQVFISSISGNKGIWFMAVEEVTSFIKGQLEEYT